MASGAINDLRVSPHFVLREFQCRCCGAVKLSPVLLDKLEALRAAWGCPIVVTSGYRCTVHNKAVGGASRSLHTRGLATDFRVAEREQERVAGIAGELGFEEIIRGGAKCYIHVALRQ